MTPQLVAITMLKLYCALKLTPPAQGSGRSRKDSLTANATRQLDRTCTDTVSPFPSHCLILKMLGI